MNRFPPLAALCLLAACSSAQNATVSSAAITTVAGAEIALTAADTVATKYITQPLCPTGVVMLTCSDPATAAALKSYGAKAYAAVKGAEAGTVTLAVAVAALNAYSAATPTSATPPATTP